MYAKVVNNTLAYPDGGEFAGVANWETCEPALREAGYMPLVGAAEQRDGYTATPSAWEVVAQSETRVEPRQVVAGGTEMVDTEIVVDTSFIRVTAWNYEPIPEPEPEEEIDWDDFSDLPTTFSKWELIQAWQGTGDLDTLLSSVGTGKQNLLVAWSSLPDTIDLQEILTRWAAMVAMASGGGVISKENIQSWLTYIKEHRNE